MEKFIDYEFLSQTCAKCSRIVATYNYTVDNPV